MTCFPWTLKIIIFLLGTEEICSLPRTSNFNKTGSGDGIRQRFWSWQKGQRLLMTALLHWFLHSDSDDDYHHGKDKLWKKNMAWIVIFNAAWSSSKIQQSEKTGGKKEWGFSSLQYMVYTRMTCLPSAVYNEWAAKDYASFYTITSISRGTNSLMSNLDEEDERKLKKNCHRVGCSIMKHIQVDSVAQIP